MIRLNFITYSPNWSNAFNPINKNSIAEKLWFEGVLYHLIACISFTSSYPKKNETNDSPLFGSINPFSTNLSYTVFRLFLFQWVSIWINSITGKDIKERSILYFIFNEIILFFRFSKNRLHCFFLFLSIFTNTLYSFIFSGVTFLSKEWMSYFPQGKSIFAGNIILCWYNRYWVL